MAAVTSLERALDARQAPAPTPLDALQLARERWLEHGRLDMGALAGELGVSRATLHRWVGSRERLLGEVLWTFAEQAIRDARAQARGTGVTYLCDSIERYMRATLHSKHVRRFLEQDPELALRVITSKRGPVQRRSIEALQEQLVEQVQAGRLQPALDPQDLAYLIVRIVESYLFSDLITGGEPDVERAIDAIEVLLSAPPVRRRRRRRVAAAA
jgi:AcrR family transcriptional regulator